MSLDKTYYDEVRVKTAFRLQTTRRSMHHQEEKAKETEIMTKFLLRALRK